MRVVLSLLVLSGPALAADRAFPFTWDTATAAPGERHLEAWLSPRLQRVTGVPYAAWELRAGLSAGLTARLDTLLAFDVTLEEFGADRRSVDARATSLWRFAFLGPDAPLGLAGLGRASLGGDALDLEARLLVDKRVGNVVLAANASAAYSALWGGRTGIDWRIEECLAAGYRVGPALVGVEARVRTAAEGRQYRGTAFYLGPSFTWARGAVFLTVGAQAQVAADEPRADRDDKEPMLFRDNERFGARVLLGVKVP